MYEHAFWACLDWEKCELMLFWLIDFGISTYSQKSNGFIKFASRYTRYTLFYAKMQQLSSNNQWFRKLKWNNKKRGLVESPSNIEKS